MTSPQTDPDRTSSRAPPPTRDAALRSALERLEAVLQGSTAWRALQQLEERERKGEWLDVIEADLLRASLLEDLARDPAYLAWRDIATVLTETDPPRSLSEPYGTTAATATARIPAVAERLPTVTPSPPPSSGSVRTDATRTVRSSPPIAPTASPRRAPDGPAPAIAIDTGRLGSSDEAQVIIRRSQQPTPSVSDLPAGSRNPTSADVSTSNPRHTLGHDEPDAVVAIFPRPHSERRADIALDDRSDTSAAEDPEAESPSDTNAEAEASVTILRNGSIPPRSTGGPLSMDSTSRRQQRDDWYAGHLKAPAPRMRLLAFTQKLHRSWRPD